MLQFLNGLLAAFRKQIDLYSFVALEIGMTEASGLLHWLALYQEQSSL